MTNKCLLILVAFLITLATSCSERYFHFSKVKADPKKEIFDLAVVNQSTGILDKTFEEQIKEYTINRLEKEGYVYVPNSAKMNFVVELRVDSSARYTYVFAGPTPLAGFTKAHNKFIRIDISCLNAGTTHVTWNDSYRAYFFCNYAQDLHRVKCLLKFMLNRFHKLEVHA